MNRHIQILIFIFFLSGCAVWPLGEDPKGNDYRVEANALVASLVKYKTDNGELPPSLNLLVPEYIPVLPEVANFAFYSKEKGSLMYSYSPSWPQLGQTSCSTVIGSGKWGCHGYI